MYKPELLYEDEAVKYHARCLRKYCNEHRCATCIFRTPDNDCMFKDLIPGEWKGIEEVKTNG